MHPVLVEGKKEEKKKEKKNSHDGAAYNGFQHARIDQ